MHWLLSIYQDKNQSELIFYLSDNTICLSGKEQLLPCQCDTERHATCYWFSERCSDFLFPSLAYQHVQKEHNGEEWELLDNYQISILIVQKGETPLIFGIFIIINHELCPTFILKTLITFLLLF